MKVYKLVSVGWGEEGSETYWSLNSACIVQYIPGQAAYPPIRGSALFAFRSAATAFSYLAGLWDRKHTKVWECEATPFTGYQPECILAYGRNFEAIWEGKVTKRDVTRPLPDGTVFCATVTLLKEVEW